MEVTSSTAKALNITIAMSITTAGPSPTFLVRNTDAGAEVIFFVKQGSFADSVRNVCLVRVVPLEIDFEVSN